MPTNEQLISQAQHVQFGNYRPAPIVLTRGRGCRVEDVEGKSYLDLSGGVAVISVGHAHPKLAAAIAEQASRLLHVSNLYYNDRAIELAMQITKRTGFERVFFCNSGAEANEALLKLARRWHYEQGDKSRVELVAATNSFHGRTIGALSVTGQPKYHAGMQPLMGGVRHVPYNDASALRAAVTNETAAVILEPLQGEGGVIVGDDEYLRTARRICDERGALLLFDEVQTGYGRTGRFLGREWSGVQPDACSLAKGIAGGFPLGAMLVTEKLSNGLPPGSHASTFGGNPLACAAGLAVLSIFDEERVVENCASVGDYLGARLEEIASRGGPVLDSRGRGLLRGLRLSAEIDVAKTAAEARNRGVLMSVVANDVLRFSPPLVIRKEEIDEGLDVITSVLRAAPRKEAA